ncbi:MAG: CbiX/SirB N-terminal domain-containing protein [Nitrososphaerota archaeon]
MSRKIISNAGLILVGHGEPPKDLPRRIIREYFELMGKNRTEAEDEHFRRLEEEIVSRPRTPRNDPYFYGLLSVAEELRKTRRFKHVWVAFNEFCRPTLMEALREACASDVDVIVVATVMLTRGGHHAEEEIPSTIEQAKSFCSKPIIYAWPIDTSDFAKFLLSQVENVLANKMRI